MKLKPGLRYLSLFSIISAFAFIVILSCENPEIGQNTDPSRAKLQKDVLDSTLQAEKAVTINGDNSRMSTPEPLGIASTSVNYALNATVSAESTYPGYSVNNIIDGDRTTTVGPTYSWANNYPAGGKLPESVFLSFSYLTNVNRIDVYTSSGYALQNYTIQYRSDLNGSWVTLVTVTGNTSTYRTHTFTAVNLVQVQIICQYGPNNQYIYGRLNEVEIYGNEPTLPTIITSNGILSFNSNNDVLQTLAYLEYNYDKHDDAFLAQYPGKTDDEIATIEESTGYNDEQPYIDFESQHNITSLRSVLTAAEDQWLATTADTYPNQNENPDYKFMEDDEVRTILNSNGKVIVANVLYTFTSDSIYTSGPVGGAVRSGTPVNNVLAACKDYKRLRGSETSGSWRFDHITSFANHPWRGRAMAKTKSYKKVSGHWKKRRAHIGATIYGNVQSWDCSTTSPDFSWSKNPKKSKKKVKARYPFNSTIKANSGQVSSFHYSDNVGTSGYNYSLTW